MSEFIDPKFIPVEYGGQLKYGDEPDSCRCVCLCVCARVCVRALSLPCSARPSPAPHEARTCTQ
jgi:hypothetical protein